MSAISSPSHIPVLLDEAVAALAVKPDGRYVDGTTGAGGHAGALLQRLGEAGELLLLDRDPAAVDHARQRFGGDPRVHIRHADFRDIARQVGESWSGPVDGILLDLGVSSAQLDQAERGFSLMRDGPLDMRMDPTTGPTAAQWLAEADETRIAEILWRYGDERHGRRIARRIVQTREREPLRGTVQLAQLVEDVVPRRRGSRVHPATRVFQALRIAVNGELQALESALIAAPGLLAGGGRLVVITFHSLEDRMVKHFMREWAGRTPIGDSRLPPPADVAAPILNLISAPKKPSSEEVLANPRARSARLRVAERTAAPLPSEFPAGEGGGSRRRPKGKPQSWHRQGGVLLSPGSWQPC